MRRYDYFKYSLPPKSADFYAGQAVEILQGIRTQFPQLYESSLKAPSEVLTLSGVRAVDFYKFGEGTDDKTIEALGEYLRRYEIWLCDDTMPLVDDSNPDKYYILIHEQAFKDLPETYTYIPAWEPMTKAIERPEDFGYWWLHWKDAMGAAIVRKELKLPEECQRNWLTVNDISLGILLGYPGEAICSTLYSDADKAAGIEVLNELSLSDAELKEAIAAGATRELRSNIPYVHLLDDAGPGYTYHSVLKHNKHIVEHQKLWSDILDKVYRELGEL